MTIIKLFVLYVTYKYIYIKSYSIMCTQLKNLIQDFFEQENIQDLPKSDTTIKDYCARMWMTLDQILTPKESWLENELVIPDSRFMT